MFLSTHFNLVNADLVSLEIVLYFPSGNGVDAVSHLVKEHLESRHMLVIHMGTNDLSGCVPVLTLYNKFRSLDAFVPCSWDSASHE